jgi:hypothetical protein
MFEQELSIFNVCSAAIVPKDAETRAGSPSTVWSDGHLDDRTTNVTTILA